MGDRLDDDDEQWLQSANQKLDGYASLDEAEAADSQGESDGEERNEWDGSDDGSSDDEEKERQRQENKKMKRKQKFQEMKAKKKAKQQADEDDANEKAAEEGQLSPAEMLAALKSHFPLELTDITRDALKRPREISEELFFYPSLDPTGTTESTTKKPCPFVRALSCSLPGYKKLLLRSKAEQDLHGCPVLLIVCASAQRATEIIKSVSSKLIKCKIAKLFAKHFKVSEQIDMLSKEYFPIAIGTPNRLLKLLEVGALSLSKTSICLVDCTEDTKRFTILSQPDTKADFYRLLYERLFDQRDHLKIALIKGNKP